MPNEMKAAIIVPVLKKSHLDNETLQRYRPISNMFFLSKLVVRIVANQLSACLRENNLYVALQSARRHDCSTETTRLHVHDNIIRRIDKRQGVALLLLDS